MNNNDLIFDKKHIWHPYTSIKNPIPVYPISSAYGYKLILNNGHHLIDGMSSWWASIHGYNHPIINKAINKQTKTLSNIMFGGITHKPAIELCKRLVSITPSDLEFVFLSDSGSVAIEIAIKMVLHYWKICGKNRFKFIALRNGYHGDTIGAMSLCDTKNYINNKYKNYSPKQKFINFNKKFNEKWCENDNIKLSNIFSNNNSSLAGVILEPIVQGAGGMRFYHPEYLRSTRILCDKYGLLLIADEIATGFGRTGKLFACNHAEITPDILCIGKALTGGTLTLSAILTNRKVSEIISKKNSKYNFMHGSTFMANPLACAAANASISILENENWSLRVSEISKILYSGLKPLINHYMVKDIRILGAIGVVETIKSINIAAIQNWFVKNGVWIRPFGNIIYLIPPYIISNKSLLKLINSIKFSLDYPNNFY